MTSPLFQSDGTPHQIAGAAKRPLIAAHGSATFSARTENQGEASQDDKVGASCHHSCLARALNEKVHPVGVTEAHQGSPGGCSPQRFCRARCRTAFWSALRRWGKQAIATGVLTVIDLRNGATAACTLQREPVLRVSSPALVPEHPGGNAPLVAPPESADES
jgi:hypothetical protein